MAKKAKRPEVLYLNVRPGTKAWLQAVTKKLIENRLGRVTRSEAADRILSNLKKRPSLLREALK